MPPAWAPPAPLARSAGNPRATTTSPYGAGDGLSCETRVIVNARTESVGLAAEYEWLGAKYPGHVVQDQSVGQCGEAAADIVSIRTADGRTLRIHFDISSFAAAAASAEAT